MRIGSTEQNIVLEVEHIYTRKIHGRITRDFESFATNDATTD